LWIDRNHNGQSESDELYGLDGFGVSTIFTNYRESRRTGRRGNRYVYVGSALVLRDERERRRAVTDVFLTVQR
jgi:hypothetical protein